MVQRPGELRLDVMSPRAEDLKCLCCLLHCGLFLRGREKSVRWLI